MDNVVRWRGGGCTLTDRKIAQPTLLSKEGLRPNPPDTSLGALMANAMITAAVELHLGEMKAKVPLRLIAIRQHTNVGGLNLQSRNGIGYCR
jgi:hypothetical protein